MMTSAALRELQDLLTPNSIRTDPDSLLNYGRDWTRIVPSRPTAIVFPSSTEDVRLTILWARRHQIALVPSGGRTGLSGGALADRGQVVISAERLNRIISINPIDRTLRAGSGVTTKAIQDHAAEHGLYYPVDFAAAPTM